jgi:hypothetical protein
MKLRNSVLAKPLIDVPTARPAVTPAENSPQVNTCITADVDGDHDGYL